MRKHGCASLATMRRRQAKRRMQYRLRVLVDGEAAVDLSIGQLAALCAFTEMDQEIHVQSKPSVPPARVDAHTEAAC